MIDKFNNFFPAAYHGVVQMAYAATRLLTMFLFNY